MSELSRLIVELNERTARDLVRRCEAENLNKTTVVNRAVQVYAAIADNQDAGGSITLHRPDGTEERFVIT